MASKSRTGKKKLKADVDVTPLVNVSLILLIVVLVTMPVQMRMITIEVPRQADEHEDTTAASRQIVLKVNADGTIVLSDGSSEQTINRVELAQTLRPMLAERRTEKVVFVDFDDGVGYGDAVSVMDTVKGSGAEKIALKTPDEPGHH
jgi:biopolymer transport protein TolR